MSRRPADPQAGAGGERALGAVGRLLPFGKQVWVLREALGQRDARPFLHLAVGRGLEPPVGKGPSRGAAEGVRCVLGCRCAGLGHAPS